MMVTLLGSRKEESCAGRPGEDADLSWCWVSAGGNGGTVAALRAEQTGRGEAELHLQLVDGVSAAVCFHVLTRESS